MDTPPIPPSSQFHPEFNRRVVEIVFQVEGVCFRLDAALLAGHSEFFSDMLGSPDLGLPGEGTEANPVVVEGTTQAQFVSFCRWITHQAGSNHVASEQNLIDILHVCSIYHMAHGINFAKDSLNNLPQPGLSPCRRLFLARLYGISEWVGQAVRQLVHKSARSYSRDDKEFIGFDIFLIIAAARESIEEARKRFANFPIEPSAADNEDAPYCSQHVKCRRVWMERWFTHLNRRIHCTRDPISLLDVPTTLDSMSHPGINASCKQRFIDCVHTSSLLDIENSVCNETSDLIMQLSMD